MSAELHRDVPKHEPRHDGADKLPSRISHEASHELTNPSSKLANTDAKERNGIPKDFGDHKSFDFKSAPPLYGDSQQPKAPGGQSHSMTDGRENAPKSGGGDAKPVAPKPDYDHSRELGDSGPAVAPIPDSPKNNDAPANSKPDSDNQSYLSKLKDTWSHGIAQMMGEQ